MTLKLRLPISCAVVLMVFGCANDKTTTRVKDASTERADGSGERPEDSGSSGERPDASESSGKDASAKQDAASLPAQPDAETAPSMLVSCDTRALRCRIAEPSCPQGKVPEIKDGCYGPCVSIERCACSEQAACPHTEQYACFMYAKHCGPYVN